MFLSDKGGGLNLVFNFLIKKNARSSPALLTISMENKSNKVRLQEDVNQYEKKLNTPHLFLHNPLF